MSIKRVVTFDVGTRNLSYFICDFDQNDDNIFEIVHWKVLDLVKKSQETSCDSLYGSHGLCTGTTKDGRPCKVSRVIALNSMCFQPQSSIRKTDIEDLKKECKRFNIDIDADADKKISKKYLSEAIRNKIEKKCDGALYCKRHYDNCELPYSIKFDAVFKKQSQKIKNISDVTDALFRYLLEDEALLSCNIVLIEKQIKRDMIVLESQIKAFFSMQQILQDRIIKVRLMHARLKMCIYDGPNLTPPPDIKKYQKSHGYNKWMAIQHAKYIMKKIGGLEEHLDRIEKEKKADDLCDTFLMAVYYVFVQETKKFKHVNYVPEVTAGRPKKFSLRRKRK
jgi:hypothetical protein